MNYIKRHKKIISFVIAAFIFFVTACNLFQKQQKRSQLINSGAIVIICGGQCAAPNVYKWLESKTDTNSKHSKNAADRGRDINSPKN